MSSLRIRSALVLATLWLGWSAWGNYPHHYDAQLMQRELTAAFAPIAAPILEPASAGFPVAYMRYDFSNNNQLTIHDIKIEGMMLNVLLCVIGIAGVTLLVVRAKRISYASIALACCLLVPALMMYVLLNGAHPVVVSYVYFIPLILLLFGVAKDVVAGRGRQNHAVHTEHGLHVFSNGNVTVRAR